MNYSFRWIIEVSNEKENVELLDVIIHFFREIDESTANELIKAYGAGGDSKYWRTLQQALKKVHGEIKYDGLDEYLKKEEKENNELAFRFIRKIETHLKNDVKDRLENEFGPNWFKKGVPIKIYNESSGLATIKNREIEDEANEIEPWDCLHLIDYRDIITQNWQKIFETSYTRKGEEKISGGKDAKTKWLIELNRIRNQNDHTYYVTSEELSFIESIHDWLNLSN